MRFFWSLDDNVVYHAKLNTKTERRDNMITANSLQSHNRFITSLIAKVANLTAEVA